MSDGNGLPDGWAVANLDCLGTISGGGTPSKSNPSYWNGGVIPWVSPKDMKSFEIADAQDKITAAAVSESSTKMIPSGSVLVVIRSGILQHTVPVGVTTCDVALNQDMKAIEPHEGIDSTYLAYALIGSQSQILNECCKDGTTVQSIEIPRFRQLPIRLAPSNEQARIADRIDELFTDLAAGVTALERVRKKLKRYRSAVLHAAVTGRLTEAWRKEHGPPAESGDQLLERLLVERRRQWEERTLADYAAKGKKPPKNWQHRYQEPVEPKSDGRPTLPEGWCWASVGQCTSVIQYGTSSRTGENTEGVPVLRMGNITNEGAIDYEKLKYLPHDHDEFPELFLRPGEILFNRTNSAELVGKSAVFESTDTCSFASYLIRARPIDGVAPWWLTWCIISPIGKGWIRTVLTHTAGQANVNGTKLASYCIPLPSQLEQTAIVDAVQEKFSQIEAIEVEVERDLARTIRLRQAILKAAFAGELVEQDSNDEPASVLLDRIRAEREVMAAESNGRPIRSRRKKAARKKTTKAAKKATAKKARKS